MLKIVMYTWFIFVDVVKQIHMNELRTQHMNSEVHEHDTGMGWLRFVGSLIFQVSFAKEPCKTDDILQKRPILRIL